MDQIEHLEHTESPANMKKQIINTFIILTILTIVDIALYFILLSSHSMAKNILFVFLGIVKAFYIVSVFMHMKFERKFLVWIIVGPMLFVSFLIWLALTEADYTFDSRLF
ncbi:MAG: cytochrome C oxidase subunit IV family protein [Candidatus Methylacidiphilales bacterium]